MPLETGAPEKGERFHATFSTSGPWFADAQHMGPPSALLMRAFERCAPSRPDAPPLQLARITIEILGVVPTGEVTVRAEVERPGRTIEMLAAEMDAGGRTVLRARAWRLGVTDTSAAAVGEAAPLPAPEEATPDAGRPEGWLPGYLDALEWRWLKKGSMAEPGPGAAWARLRVPVVEGEEPSALQRLVAAADSANGVAAPLDLREWLFVNTELTVHLHRPPRGEWSGMDSATVIGPSGTGTVSATLFDLDGQVGRITQELTVRPR
ncbi:MAG: thioesterase family protein [Pseudonocardia sp.]|nr:thioesterase family protein [Pseudonocardia sp.]